MDGCACHKSQELDALFDQHGIVVVFLPPHSSDQVQAVFLTHRSVKNAKSWVPTCLARRSKPDDAYIATWLQELEVASGWESNLERWRNVSARGQWRNQNNCHTRKSRCNSYQELWHERGIICGCRVFMWGYEDTIELSCILDKMKHVNSKWHQSVPNIEPVDTTRGCMHRSPAHHILPTSNLDGASWSRQISSIRWTQCSSFSALGYGSAPPAWPGCHSYPLAVHRISVFIVPLLVVLLRTVELHECSRRWSKISCCSHRLDRTVWSHGN